MVIGPFRSRPHACILDPMRLKHAPRLYLETANLQTETRSHATAPHFTISVISDSASLDAVCNCAARGRPPEAVTLQTQAGDRNGKEATDPKILALSPKFPVRRMHWPMLWKSWTWIVTQRIGDKIKNVSIVLSSRLAQLSCSGPSLLESHIVVTTTGISFYDALLVQSRARARYRKSHFLSHSA